MNSERRRHKRYLPLDQNVFAALGRDFTKIGKIRDISLGGLSFDYIVGQCVHNDDATVDVFLTDRPLHIHNAQCQAIYDNCISSHGAMSDVSCFMTVRRSGIRFIMLSAQHQEQIELLLERYCFSCP
jgi:hypothetical protein